MASVMDVCMERGISVQIPELSVVFTFAQRPLYSYLLPPDLAQIVG